MINIERGTYKIPLIYKIKYKIKECACQVPSIWPQWRSIPEAKRKSRQASAKKRDNAFITVNM